MAYTGYLHRHSSADGLGPPEGVTGYALYHVLAGGLLLSFYGYRLHNKSYDQKGTVIYALGCGLLTIVFRLYTGMSEVSPMPYSYECATPLIDRLTRPRRFGGATHV